MAVPYRILAAAAVINGEVPASEQVLLDRAATQLGLEPEEAEEILEQVRTGHKISKKDVPEDPKARRELLCHMIRLIGADGDVDADELRMLRKVAPLFELSEFEMEDLARSEAEEIRRKNKKK
jgi:uncharacterized tellurite resistance protein B-like protein